MKKSYSFLFLVIIIYFMACRPNNLDKAGAKVTVDNDKVKVTEYVGDPSNDVCGVGLHTHGPHLTILLSDGQVKETIDGKSTIHKLLKGLSFWSDGDRHMVKNIGASPVKSIIIEVKKPH